MPKVLNPKLTKTSLGTEKLVKWQYFTTIKKALASLPPAVQIISLEQTSKSQDIFQAQIKFPIALIVGNEKTGVSPDSLAKSDQVLHIPMFGQHNSLNVGCAAAIALYWLKNSFSTSVIPA